MKPDIVNIAVSKTGDIYIEKKAFTMLELREELSKKYKANTNLPVYISGDKEALHGVVISVLDEVRKLGIQKVAFAIRPGEAK